MEGVCARDLVIGREFSSLTNDGVDQCPMQKRRTAFSSVPNVAQIHVERAKAKRYRV
jgi:hypothetical protein